MRLERYTQAAEAVSAVQAALDRATALRPGGRQHEAVAVTAMPECWQSLLAYIEETAEMAEARR